MATQNIPNIVNAIPVKEGDPVVRGVEFGFIKFGSRVDVFLPLDAEILVKVDEKTKAGRTPLARLHEIEGAR